MSSSPLPSRRGAAPSPATTPTQNGKPETFLEYLGTLGRKKKLKEGIDRSIEYVLIAIRSSG